MNILRDNKTIELDQKIKLEMTVGDFLSMYIAKMTCSPSDFESCQDELFPEIQKDLFVESANTEEMEWIIDEINFPHQEWL